MKCPHCGARATHNGDAYHCGTRVDGEQSKQCKNVSGDVVPFRYMPTETGTAMPDEREQELREIFSAVLKTKGRVPNTLRVRIKKFLGDK